MAFKKGDRVRVIGMFECKDLTGKEGIVCHIADKQGIRARVGVFFDDYIEGHDCNGRCKNGYGWYGSESELLLINDSKIFMSIQEKFSMLFVSEPEKSFKKAGITNPDGTLTSDGATIFNAWLLKKFGNEFKTEVVDELLKECK